jgi:transposase InsO family protein
MKMHQKQFPVEMMCKVLKVSSSSFYAWKNGSTSKRIRKELLLKDTIESIYNGSHYTYGSPRVYELLKQAEHKVSRSLVARVMRKYGFRSIHAKKFKVTTDSSHKYPVCENILDRDFTAVRPAQKWVSDLTYIATKEGWLYLTVILDLYDRKVIGWAMSNNMSARDTTVCAWNMANLHRPITGELLFHSDRGIQYACNEFTQTINHPLITQSMSRKGNCWDNAVAESFFKSLKKECVYRYKYQTRKQAELSVFQWIEGWYNTNRIHSALKQKSIQMFNNQKNNQILAA